MVESGDFRQDLFYRIHVIELSMAPLRERREDIPVTIEHILDRLAQRMGDARPRLAREALKALLAYDYPGNVRELENILERATALCEADTIRFEDLQLGQRSPTSELADDHPQPGAGDFGGQGLEDYLAQVERDAIVQALEKTRWNRTAAARLLGITFRALRYRLDKLGLDDMDVDKPAKTSD
jgi:two-component system response regulator PilR (NtrC family)